MRRKLYTVIVVMILMLSALAIKVSAYSFTTSMTPSSTKVAPSTEFVITVKVSNLSVGDNGINLLNATIDYDSDVFETINESNIEGLNGWEETFESGTAKITMKKSSFVNDDEEIFQVTLKVKSDVDEGTRGNVSLSNIVASNSEEEISATNISTTITVGASSGGAVQILPKNDANNTGNNSSNNSSNGIITPIGNNSSNTSNNSSNNSITNISPANTSNNVDNNMPYTGPGDNAMMRIIFGVVIIALVAYIKIEKLNSDIKK